MGGTTENVFLPDQLDTFLPDVKNYDLVFLAVQECHGNRMTNRVNALEVYLRSKGYENID